MKNQFKWTVSSIGILKLLIATAIIATGLNVTPGMAQEVTVIHLTQTPCQFLESENEVDHGFTSSEKSDCDQINSETGTERLSKAKVLDLKPGKYIFRVTNKNVSYPLGFWLRGDGLINRAKLPSVSGGGLYQESTKEYVITLKEGEYVYSCPLNPTPDYKLVVRE